MTGASMVGIIATKRRKGHVFPLMNLGWMVAWLGLLAIQSCGLLMPVYAAPTSTDAPESNPYTAGCLRHELGDGYPRRICNSDDDPGEDTLCSVSRFDYTEIRIHNSNWESSIFYAWIIQILLSERVEVPASIESIGSARGVASFYHPDNFELPYSDEVYPYHAVKEAHEIGDCRTNGGTKPCAHILPEVWSKEQAHSLVAKDEGYIEAVLGNGMVGKISWYIPKFLADKDPTLVSHYGMRGNANRKKLAETFGRPTTWLEWCRDLSPSSCSTSIYDGTATRWPTNGTTEETSYFVKGLYTGHFRFTEENNCTLNRETCTGHIAEPPCTWGSYTESQVYWNDMALKSNGPLEPAGGYSYESMIEIWKAANATQSAVIMWWWRPDATVQEFQNTPYEFQPVALTTPTEECTRSRVTGFCKAELPDRIGKEVGSCDYEANALRRIVAASLQPNTYRVPIAERSPAYDMIKTLQVSDLSFENMLSSWIGLNRTGADARKVVCSWVASNIDALDKLIVPRGYPRQVSDGSYDIAFLHITKVLAALAVFGVLSTGAATYYWRDSRVIQFAQIQFLLLILLGFLLISVGAVITAFEPSSASCVARPWLVMLGYTLAIVPLLVKVAAINKMDSEAKRLRRVKLSRTNLYGFVLLMVVLVFVFLIVWTAIDPPTRDTEWVLVGEGPTVEVSARCASSFNMWNAIAVAWVILLLVCASILAWQNRNVRQEFNESRSLAFATYSHLMFVLLGLVTFLLPSKGIPAYYRAGVTSLLLSLDTLCSIFIYFLPKFMSANNKEAESAG